MSAEATTTVTLPLDAVLEAAGVLFGVSQFFALMQEGEGLPEHGGLRAEDNPLTDVLHVAGDGLLTHVFGEMDDDERARDPRDVRVDARAYDFEALILAWTNPTAKAALAASLHARRVRAAGNSEVGFDREPWSEAVVPV